MSSSKPTSILKKRGRPPSAKTKKISEHLIDDAKIPLVFDRLNIGRIEELVAERVANSMLALHAK